MANALTDKERTLMDAYWRAANYLSVGQIYLYDNPLLKQPLTKEHIKPRLLGHWGTTPGLNFIYVHLNRLIKKHDLDMIYITGPGHGGPGLVANAYLEGTYSEVYPNISPDEEGMKRLFTQFSFPGGIPSHVAPETPGSIHEGGELGYAVSHAYGAAFDNPDLIVACVVGDGEAETGPLATSWHSNKFLNPATDGAVLPILHLNGYKIANPTVLARISHEELDHLFRGYGYTPYFVEGHEPAEMHELMAATLDTVIGEIQRIKADARENGFTERPRWPMIVLAHAQGLDLPEGDRRQAHRGLLALAPGADGRDAREPRPCAHPRRVDEELSARRALRRQRPAPDRAGRARPARPPPHERQSACQRRLAAARSAAPGFPRLCCRRHRARRRDGRIHARHGQVSARCDEAEHGRAKLPAFQSRTRTTQTAGRTRSRSPIAPGSRRPIPWDDHLAPDGRVMEMLSEHQCQGWLEGYLLTGRHGFFSCYEAFIHIIDSMFNQHAKWLKVCNHIPWRRPIASLNYLLSSHVWRQDHNGFSHQDPGFIDHVVNKKAEVVRVYLPPDANCLLSVTDHCLRSRNYVNVVVAGKQPAPQWLTMDQAIKHCTAGSGSGSGPAMTRAREPDVVMACCGDVPTLETLAAVDLLRQHAPELKVRVINVVDLMKLQPPSEHPHGLSDHDFDALFTTDKPIIFAFHGYPWLIHRLTYRRNGHDNIHVRGYKEEGTTTTPFDMCVLNDLDRFHLVSDVIDRVPKLGARAAYAKQAIRDKLIEHKEYICRTATTCPRSPAGLGGRKRRPQGCVRPRPTTSDRQEWA